jgi:Tfp pilus assembly protein PilF
LTSIFVLATLASVVGISVHLRQRSLDARRHLELSTQAEGDGEFSATRAELDQYLAIQPGDASAHFRLARAARREPRENFSLAQEHLQAAYSGKYSAAEINLETALLAFQSSGEPGKEEEALKSYLARRPESEPLILEALARGCLRAGRLGDANTWLNQWVRKYPDDWYARLWRGSLFQHLSQPALAIEDYRQVLKARPERRDVRRRLGLMLARSGYDFKEAGEYLEEAIQSQPDDLDARVALASCLHAQRQTKQAQAMLLEVLNRQPDHVDGLIGLALVELELRQDQEALKNVNTLLPLAERFDSQQALEQLLQLEPVAYAPQATQRLETILHLQATVLRRLGRDGEGRAAQARLQLLQENGAALTRAVLKQQEHPRDADLLCKIGELQISLGRDDEGARWLKKAIQAVPAHQKSHELLSEYYEGFDNPEARARAEEHRRFAKGKM